MQQYRIETDSGFVANFYGFDRALAVAEKLDSTRSKGFPSKDIRVIDRDTGETLKRYQ